MADKIELEIVTPKGKALGVSVDEVTAPGKSGEFGILPGHLPMLAALRSGIVSYRSGAETHRCAVAGGFAEAGPDKLLILTEDFTERETIDPVQVRKALIDVDAELQAQKSDESVDTAFARKRALAMQHNWLATQLELHGDPPPPFVFVSDTDDEAPIVTAEVTEEQAEAGQRDQS